MDLAKGQVGGGDTYIQFGNPDAAYNNAFRDRLDNNYITYATGATANGIRYVGSGVAAVNSAPLDLLTYLTDSPAIAAAAGFYNGLAKSPFNLVAGLVDTPSNVGNIADTFISYYESGGNVFSGSFYAVMGSLGTLGAYESYTGVDFLTGRRLNGDERFDRAVSGAGAIGGTVLVGYGLAARAGQLAFISNITGRAVSGVGRGVGRAGRVVRNAVDANLPRSGSFSVGSTGGNVFSGARQLKSGGNNLGRSGKQKRLRQLAKGLDWKNIRDDKN